MSDRYAVIGHPVEHSLSPEIQAAFAQQTGQDIAYEAILVEIGRFADAVEDFHASGGKAVS